MPQKMACTSPPYFRPSSEFVSDIHPLQIMMNRAWLLLRKLPLQQTSVYGGDTRRMMTCSFLLPPIVSVSGLVHNLEWCVGVLGCWGAIRYAKLVLYVCWSSSDYAQLHSGCKQSMSHPIVDNHNLILPTLSPLSRKGVNFFYIF